ncbi:hypothetical protein ACFS7Z_10840 [Pontibacter toksunensis]|uniref:Uncharacterized protein n=1 Tax=Pontibacter toksunensis TaxID=1332631 RepID=A0ABW6BWU7_9BACT
MKALEEVEAPHFTHSLSNNHLTGCNLLQGVAYTMAYVFMAFSKRRDTGYDILPQVVYKVSLTYIALKAKPILLQC